MKKILVIMMCLLLLTGVTGCKKEEEVEVLYHVGILQFTVDENMAAANEGFIEGLKEILGGTVETVAYNASGETVNCTTIINGLISDKVDMIMCTGDEALKTAAEITDSLPLVGTCIADYSSLITAETGKNITGVTGEMPITQNIELIKALLPEAKKVAVIITETTDTSQIERALREAEYEITRYIFSGEEDVGPTLTQACRTNDLLFVPNNELTMEWCDTIADIAITQKKVIITDDLELCLGCGLACVGIDYRNMGYTAGKMAASILKGEAKPEDLKTAACDKFAFYGNKAIAEALEMTLPEGFIEIEE